MGKWGNDMALKKSLLAYITLCIWSANTFAQIGDDQIETIKELQNRVVGVIRQSAMNRHRLTPDETREQFLL